MVKHLSPLQETQVRSLGQEDPLEEEMGNPLQYSCLENPRDGGAWLAAIKSQTLHFHFQCFSEVCL